jgi:ABC-2 type transport system ATP-binding protein
VIRVDHLTKTYGTRRAVDDVSFEVGRGEVVGFLGPNGAGKTTTLRILAGVLGPTEGSVTIAGHDLVDDWFEARRSIGYMPEAVPLYPEMRVVEYLRFRAELKGVPRGRREGQVAEAMQRAGVTEMAQRTILHLSRGYRQRVGIADAIVAKPPVVILDEPTAGLDPNQIRHARELIRELGREHAVIVSTHILGEVEACATRVVLIHLGKLVAKGAIGELRAMRRVVATELTVRGDPAAALAAARGVEGVKDADIQGDATATLRLRATFTDESSDAERTATTERVVDALVRAGLAVSEVRAAGGSLEDVFAALTESRAEPAAGPVH